jgi:hypothetical protein
MTHARRDFAIGRFRGLAGARILASSASLHTAVIYRSFATGHA